MHKIDKTFIETDNGIRSNDPINQKVDWSKIKDKLLNEKQLNLYNVQFKTTYNLINKFVYAYDRDDAIKLVYKKYESFMLNIDDVYCQKVDIQHGMMF